MIDTQAIRNKILDLAMRGKLTEQRSDEEVDFYEVITKDTPYTLPRNWKWVKIGSIITKDVGGGTPSKSVAEYWNGGTIPWMSVKDFSSARKGVLEDTVDHITQVGLENSSSNLVDTDAIIICMRMALGKIVKINQPMAINQDLRAIWLNSCVEKDFFVFYYSTLKVEGHGMTVAGINKKQLMEYMMPLPPLAEQQRIVDKIDQAFSILDTIDALQAKYADNLTALKAKLIDAAIQGKLTEQLPEDGTAEELYRQIRAEKQALIKAGKIKKEKPLPEITVDEIPFEIPENWKWCRLLDLCKSVSDGDHQAPPQVKEGIPFLVISNVSKGFIDLTDVRHVPFDYYNSLSYERTAEQGDVLFTVTGSFGIPVIVDTGEKFCFQRHMALLKPLIDTAYLHHALQSGYVQKKCDDIAIGTAQRTVGIKQLRIIPIPLPPLEEQRRISERLERLFSTL
ncbi:MAG: restriction endonuclease subunit S [Blautia sp.]|nr:restriction endonuclease subunit S [Blautia sp.]